MSKLYNFGRWVWFRLAYWGDKLLTLTFYLLVGLFILSWKALKSLKKGVIYALRAVWSRYQDYRLIRRIKAETKTIGKNRSIIEEHWERKNNGN